MLIDEPLAALLARVDADTLDRGARVIAPIMLVGGLLVYAVRVNRLIDDKRAASMLPTPAPKAEKPAQARFDPNAQPKFRKVDAS